MSCSLVGEEEEEIVGIFVKTIWPQFSDRLSSCLYAATQRLCNGFNVCCPLLLQAALSIMQLAEQVRNDIGLNMNEFYYDLRTANYGEGQLTL